jgi:CubicO group peptidase (beta-lactamase class C family)
MTGRLLLVGFILLVSTDRVIAAEGNDFQAFEVRLERLRADVKIPGFSAAIAQGGKIVWCKGFGLADVEANVAATPETCYHLASLTKTFASTVVMQLVEAGKIDLDAPVSDYGVTLQSEGTVRVKHLLNHTSEGVPGTRYSYNGNRFALLDTVIESASGRTFGQLVCERIIGPLSLNNTAPNVQDVENFALTGLDPAKYQARLAKGYRLEKDGGSTPVAYPAHFSSAAGLTSTVLDVARYSIALDQGKLVSQASLERAMTKGTADDGRKLPYGLGWFVLERNGTKFVWHYGLWTGNSSLIIKVPSRQWTFVVLANSERLTSSYFHGRGELVTSPFARAFIEGFVGGR